MWSGSELNFRQPFNGREWARELRERTPRATAETKTRLETQTHSVYIHLSPVGEKKKTHMHRVKIYWQGAAGQWPKGEWQSSRCGHGHSGGFWVKGHLFFERFHIKGLCASTCYSTLLKCILHYQTKPLFCFFMLLHFASNNRVVSGWGF